MIDSILGWLAGTNPGGARELREALQLALTALLVEAASSDDHFDQAEREVIARLLTRRFELPQSEARALLAAGESEASRTTQLFRFTRIVNERLSLEERIEVVEMLWEVAYADGVLDQYEDSLLRRVGGLIYVPDHDRAVARQRVLRRRGLDGAA